MRIIINPDRDPDLINQLMNIWESSVRATHSFLTDTERENIKEYVPDALAGIANLAVAMCDNNIPVGFMGVENQKLEMLFIHSDMRGHGIGKKLIAYGIENLDIQTLTVNEQNPQAIGFYEHIGFQIYKRTDIDEQGNPYPLLYMRIKK